MESLLPDAMKSKGESCDRLVRNCGINAGEENQFPYSVALALLLARLSQNSVSGRDELYRHLQADLWGGQDDRATERDIFPIASVQSCVAPTPGMGMGLMFSGMEERGISSMRRLTV